MHGRKRVYRGEMMGRKCMKLTSGRVPGYQLFREVDAITFASPPAL